MGDRLGIPGAVDFRFSFFHLFLFPELTFALLYIVYKIFMSYFLVYLIDFINILINQYKCLLICCFFLFMPCGCGLNRCFVSGCRCVCVCVCVSHTVLLASHLILLFMYLFTYLLMNQYI
jgi:hypothetical protein